MAGSPNPSPLLASSLEWPVLQPAPSRIKSGMADFAGWPLLASDLVRLDLRMLAPCSHQVWYGWISACWPPARIGYLIAGFAGVACKTCNQIANASAAGARREHNSQALHGKEALLTVFLLPLITEKA